MPKWAKWALLWAWVAGGVTFTILTEYDDDDFEERTVDSARMTVAAHPADGDEELAPELQMTIEVEIAEGGDLLRLVLDGGDVRGANPNGPEIEMVLEDRRDVYLHPLTDKPRMPRGKSWIQLDFEQVESVAPEFAGVLRIVESDGLLTSKPALPDEYESGTETIDGVEMTRYEVSADAAELGDLQGIPATALVGDDVEMTTWMDTDGFLRRIVLPMNASYLAPGAGEGTVELHYDIYDLGGDVTIELPDDEDVFSG